MLIKMDVARPNGDPFIPGSEACLRNKCLSKMSFARDPNIEDLHSKIAAIAKQASVIIYGFIWDRMKGDILMMAQKKVKHIAFHFSKLTKHISNCVFEKSCGDCRWLWLTLIFPCTACSLP
jgi:hypothetical protein